MICDLVSSCQIPHDGKRLEHRNIIVFRSRQLKKIWTLSTNTQLENFDSTDCRPPLVCAMQCELSLGPPKEPPYLLKWMNGCEFWCLVHSIFDESLFELEGDFVHSGEDDESPAGL